MIGDEGAPHGSRAGGIAPGNGAAEVSTAIPLPGAGDTRTRGTPVQVGGRAARGLPCGGEGRSAACVLARRAVGAARSARVPRSFVPSFSPLFLPKPGGREGGNGGRTPWRRLRVAPHSGGCAGRRAASRPRRWGRPHWS